MIIAIAVVIAGFLTIGKSPIGAMMTIETGVVAYYAIQAMITSLL